MNSSDSANGTLQRSVVIRSAIVIALIALSAALIVLWINSSEPEAKREGATKRTAMLVEVMKMKSGTHAPTVVALGRVRAAQDIELAPQVSGYITEVADAFIPGGFVEKGELLAKIEAADYQNTLRQAQSELAQAEADLSLELGRKDSATKEFELLEPDLSEANRALVLREPQLNSARSRVLAAEAAVHQAELNLKRTEIRAPFTAHILSQNIHPGSQVSSSSIAGRLVGTNEYWVEVSVPVSSLKDITLPSGEGVGARATVRDRNAWPEGMSREGEVIRLIGALDNNTRLARLLVSVKDPLGRAEGQQRGALPLLLESIVQVAIDGRPLENVFRVPRDYLRQDNTLWLNRDNKLVISDATLVTKDSENVYLSEGLEDGDLLITSNLATVAPGTLLRTAQEAEE